MSTQEQTPRRKSKKGKNFCCACLFSNTNKKIKNLVEHENSQTRQSQQNQSVMVEKNSHAERPKINILTQYDIIDIQFTSVRPEKIFAQLYPYNCPICARFFNKILKHSCCKNYVCLYCVNSIQEFSINHINIFSEVGEQKLPAYCWWCRTDSFIIEDIDQQDEIKVYSDYAYSNSKYHMGQHKQPSQFDNNSVGADNDLVQTIKSLQFNNFQNNIQVDEDIEQDSQKSSSRADFSPVDQPKVSKSKNTPVKTKNSLTNKLGRLASENINDNLQQLSQSESQIERQQPKLQFLDDRPPERIAINSKNNIQNSKQQQEDENIQIKKPSVSFSNVIKRDSQYSIVGQQNSVIEEQKE